MANKGLKSYTKQISQTIGDVAKVSVNVNKADANMHIIIPLFQTLGPNPLDLSLIYNYQDRNDRGQFGKGCNLSTFKDIQTYSNRLEIYDADGSCVTYTPDEQEDYYSKETPLKVIKEVVYYPGDGDYDTFIIKDKLGNSMFFDENHTIYPTSIDYKNGFKTTFDGANMDNNHGAKVTFTETSNYMYSRATYTQDGTTLYYVDFEYDSNQRLISVKHYKESKLIKHLSITYFDTEIKVKDEISKDYAIYTFVSHRVEKVQEVVNDNLNTAITTSIQYEDRRTTIIDYTGKKVYLYFDINNLPLYEFDADGNVVETEYDSTSKKLIKESSVIPTKNKLNTLAAPIITKFTRTSGIHTALASLSDPIFLNILPPIFKVSGSGSLTYNYSIKGLGGDRITVVIWGKQLTGYSDTSNVTVSLAADGVATDTFKKTITDGQFDMMILGVTAVKSYSNIKLTITLKGNPSIEIGGIQILKKDYGAIYEYDKDGNGIGIESGMGSTSSAYDGNGLKTQSVGRDSSLYQYFYDTKGNPVLLLTAYGGYATNIFDSNNNLTGTVVSNSLNSKKLESSTTYDSNGRFVTKKTDELGNSTFYDYDSFGKIKKVTDALNAITEYRYDEFDNLTKILFNNSTAASYTYDSQNKLTKVTLANSSEYSFGYDASNNLKSVSMNGTLIVSFTYDSKTGLITKQTYGSEGDTYDFEYNEKHNVSKIKVNGKDLYAFEYNQYDQLITVKNNNGAVLNSYTYDNDGQITKINSNGCEIEYSYNSLGEISQKKRTLNSKRIYQSYDSVSKSKGFSPDNMIGYLQGNNDFAGTLFNNSAALKNPTIDPILPYDCKTYSQTIPDYSRVGMIPCVKCGNQNLISYDPPSTPNHVNSGSIAFWLYPTSLASGNRYLFYTKADNENSSVAVYQKQDYLFIELIDTSKKRYTYQTTTKLQLNQWNFFGFNFSFQNSQTFKCELYLNKEIKTASIDKSIITNGGRYHIGYRLNGNYTADVLDCKIMGLLIGCRKELTREQIQQYHTFSKYYISEVSYLDGTSVDFSGTSIHNLSEAMLNQFEIYPLHNDVKSLSGKSPVAFDVRRLSETDKDRTFNYNQQIKRYAYVTEQGRLEYALDMTTSGTVLLRVFSKEERIRQYIFEMKSSTSDKTIGVYKDFDNTITIDIEGKSVYTDFIFENNKWHTIGLSYEISGDAGSISTSSIGTVRLYFDGKTYSKTVDNTNFQAKTLSIGRLFNKYIDEYQDEFMEKCDPYYPLFGQVEMLATRAAFCEVSTLNALANELKDSTKASEYDELGMLQREVIKEGDKDIFTDEYSYKKKSTYSIYISKYIEKEKIKFGSTTVERNYGINALGNVTSITDSTFGNHTYTYDTRGFLTKEDSTEYKYDSNGNITKAGSTTFTYDTTIKDRLISVNGNEIKYGTNPLNPLSYNGNNYTFEGRRLVKYNSIEYTYDDLGLRISKKVNNDTTNYYYDGDKLITEISPNYRLDFLYDENGKLYGFIKDNTAKYYYIRDFMQNILGIIDSSGNLVVKYSYDAYGNSKGHTDNSGIGLASINPFRYKGYYYDTETKMYYCESGYYVPEWCRWLNGDISSLNPFDINGLNLHAYCGNNPIVFSYRKETIKVISTAYNVFSPIYSYSSSVSSVIGSSSTKVSKNPLSFSVGIITPENFKMESWMTIYAFYAKGSIGPNYTVEDGFSIASFGVGVLDATFHTPKWFSSLPNDHLANPNIYLGVGTWNVNASIGAGISGVAEILSGTAGMQFGNAVSMQVKGYVGAGITIDFSHGIKIGGGLGFGYEISFNFDWYELFH